MGNAKSTRGSEPQHEFSQRPVQFDHQSVVSSQLSLLLSKYFGIMKGTDSREDAIITSSDQYESISTRLGNESVPLDVFLTLLKYLTVEEIFNAARTCSLWYHITHCEELDEILWMKVSYYQELRERRERNFPGSLFSCQGYVEYTEEEEEARNKAISNLFYRRSGNWRNYCQLARIYCKICEECFKRAFTGVTDLFKGTEPDLFAKVWFLGPQKIGKTNLIRSITKGRRLSTHGSIMPTLGTEVTTACSLIDQTLVLAMQNYDPSDGNREIFKLYSRGAAVRILLFDLSNESSLSTLIEGLSYNKFVGKRKDSSAMLIGLKSDVKESNHISNRALEFAAKYNMFYLECSCMTGENIETISRMIPMLCYFVLANRKVAPA